MDVRIEPHSNYLEITLSGEYRQDDIPEEGRASSIAEFCKKHQLKHVLINAEKLEGSIDTMTRYWGGREIADAFGISAVKIAVIGNPKQMDLQSLPFFETVAKNRGAIVKVVTDFDAAMEWLME